MKRIGLKILLAIIICSITTSTILCVVSIKRASSVMNEEAEKMLSYASEKYANRLNIDFKNTEGLVEKIDIRSGVTDIGLPENPNVLNFFLPILVLVGATIYFDVDMQMGVLVTMAFMFVLFLAQNLMSAEDFSDVSLQGIKNMILPLMLMVLAFLFAEVNDQIGFTYYVISSASKYMTPELMPVTVFLILAVTEFITGTNWGMYVIALPIVIPLAAGLDVNMALAVSAVLSAGVFGSHVCFYSDATVLTSAATGCNNFDHAYTQAPFGIMAAAISAVCFLIAGFIF